MPNLNCITHIFFDVHDVLVDRSLLGRCYADGVGKVMAERYGGTPEIWAEANQRVTADWSYLADLDFSGDDGIHNAREGQYRTTRALFRMTGIPEPPHDELLALSRELPGLAPLGCAALYPDVPESIGRLHDMGLTLGVISHAWEGHIRATLEAVIQHFDGRIWGADTAQRFDKDPKRYRMAAKDAGVAPRACMVLDDKPRPLTSAYRTGMTTVLCDRIDKFSHFSAHYRIHSLSELVPICEKILSE